MRSLIQGVMALFRPTTKDNVKFVFWARLGLSANILSLSLLEARRLLGLPNSMYWLVVFGMSIAAFSVMMQGLSARRSSGAPRQQLKTWRRLLAWLPWQWRPTIEAFLCEWEHEREQQLGDGARPALMRARLVVQLLLMGLSFAFGSLVDFFVGFVLGRFTK